MSWQDGLVWEERPCPVKKGCSCRCRFVSKKVARDLDPRKIALAAWEDWASSRRSVIEADTMQLTIADAFLAGGRIALEQAASAVWDESGIQWGRPDWVEWLRQRAGGWSA